MRAVNQRSRRTLETVMAAGGKLPQQGESIEQERPSLSWAAMLALVFMAILLAAGFAYLLVNPFFHQRTP